MTELAYVEVNPNGYSYCSFPYYWTSDTSVIFENLHIPIQTTGGRGVNLFQEGPGRFQSYGNGLDATPPNDISNILDIRFGYYDYGTTPSTPYYLLTYEAPNGIDGTLEIGNAYIKLNGTTVATGTTYTGGKVTLSQPFYFFNSFNNSWAHNYIREGYCGKVKFYENGVLSAVYTPYLDDNGVAGYYDENNQVMIYSLRNAWVAGPEAKSIKATPSKSYLAYTGETISIEVSCENAWTLTTSGDTFLTFSSTGDTSGATITATAPNYSGSTAREEIIIFTDTITSDTAEITIKQKKYSAGQPVYLGGNEVTEIYLGSTAITEAYLGDVQVYSSGNVPTPTPTPTPSGNKVLTVENSFGQYYSLYIKQGITYSRLCYTDDTDVYLDSTATAYTATWTDYQTLVLEGPFGSGLTDNFMSEDCCDECGDPYQGFALNVAFVNGSATTQIAVVSQHTMEERCACGGGTWDDVNQECTWPEPEDPCINDPCLCDPCSCDPNPDECYCNQNGGTWDSENQECIY